MLKKVFLLIFIVAINFASAQKKEGYIKYKINYSGDSMEMQLAASMMKNATLEIYFDTEKTRVDMKTPGVYDIVSIVNTVDNEVLTLFEVPMMGQKKYIKSSITEFEDYNDNSKNEKSNIEFVNETKTILGYKCKKAIMKGEGIEISYWYTEDIKVNTIGQQNFNINIPGHPLEFVTKGEGITVSFVATEFSKLSSEQKNKVFSTKKPEGYQEATYDDIKTGTF